MPAPESRLSDVMLFLVVESSRYSNRLLTGQDVPAVPGSLGLQKLSHWVQPLIFAGFAPSSLMHMSTEHPGCSPCPVQGSDDVFSSGWRAASSIACRTSPSQGFCSLREIMGSIYYV